MLNGRSCPKCYAKIPYNFESLSEAIDKKHNGEIKLVSDQQIKGVKRKYKFRHSCGNEWLATADAILSGKSCPACVDYGFNSSKPATFYILEISGNEHDFTGFGISNNFERRKTQHKNNLKVNNCSITSEILIESGGEIIQNLEQYVKRTLQCNNSTIMGFRTESLLISPEELKIFCENYLQSLGISYKLSVNT